MKKVTGVLILKKHLTNWEIKIFDQARIINECLQQWHKSEAAESIELAIDIKSKFQFKTRSQLGYIHASVKPTIILWAISQGSEQTEKEIWNAIKAELKFIEQKVSPVTGESYWDVKSLAGASKEEVSEFIDKLVRWAGEWGIKIESPDEYKQRNNIKQWK